MMRVLIFIIVGWASIANAGELGAHVFLIQPPPFGGLIKDGIFQGDVTKTSGNSFDATYFWGEVHGPTVGVSYTNRHMEFVDCRSQPCPRYVADVNLPQATVGYHFKPKPDFRVWGQIGYGRGDSSFQDKDKNLSPIKRNSSCVSISARAAYRLELPFGYVPLIFGAEFTKGSQSDFVYNGQSFEVKGINTSFHLLLGLGYEF